MRRLMLTTTSLLLMAAGVPAVAQPTAQPAPVASDQIDFAADSLSYQDDSDVVTATGDVRLMRDGNRVRADLVIWNRKSGEVRAEGNVSIVNPGGDTAYGDSVVLTDSLRDGMVDNLLLVLADGARLAARRGTLKDDVATLQNAAYSPCPVVGGEGCSAKAKKPSWQITAVRIVSEPKHKRLTFRQARLELFGVPLFVIPKFSVRTGNEGGPGFLMPTLEYTRTNGVEVSLPYYYKIADNRDLTLTPHVYSNALPVLEGSYRALLSKGAYRIGGYATYSSRIPNGTTGIGGTRDFRGYLDASGRFQLDPQWSIKASIRRATDRTFLKRYDISYEDRLRSTVSAERITPDSYLSVTGWAVQTLRANVAQGTIPVALPEIDYRRRLTDPIVGGRIELQLNALVLDRTAGQDTQRAFAGVRWDLRRVTALGQEVILTAYGRGDVYHSTNNALTTTALYRGQPGWQARAIGALAAEVRWPFVGPLMNGTQRLTPRLQVVASPTTSNLNIPNEDARAVDLEDSNLFALNRFPGYDRWEDGTRITYGLDYGFDAPRISVAANIGQSYRLTAKPTLFPDGTGLTDRASDIVGRVNAKYRDVVALTWRYRLDKDGLVLRRSEIDATIGNDRTYALIGYLRLNRNIDPTLEDLRDREEIRLGGRVQVARYWSVYGSTTIDLTDRAEDPLSLANGYQPIRHRIGIAYTDPCLDIGLTWRRDYQTAGDARRGDSFLLRLVFRGLGR